MERTSHSFFYLIRTPISWLLVAVCTIVVSALVLFAFLALVPFDRDRKHIQHIHTLISFWARLVLIVCPVMAVQLNGIQHLRGRGPYVLVANHQSLSDILALLHLAHPFKFMGKKELFWIPFFGWALSLAGHIPLVRGDRESGHRALERASEYVGRGVSVLLFPEGTRSRDGNIHDFKVGAFKIAVERRVPVVPIVIDGTRDVIQKGSLVIGPRRKVMVQIEAPVMPKRNNHAGIEEMSREVRSKMIRRLEEIRSRG